MTAERFVEIFAQERAAAILRTSIEEAAAPAMEAAVRAGFRIVEFTLTVPGAFDRIAEFARRDELVVGAGSVLTVTEAEEAVRRGARFLVSPVLDLEILDAARGLGVCMLPGCFTPTEMLQAHRRGALAVKLFPSPASGPEFVRACLGPMPFLKIVPTNGVTVENARGWLEAGCLAVGFGNRLFEAADLAERRFDRIESRARVMRDSVR